MKYLKILITLFPLFFLSCDKKADEGLPNIVLFYIDDMGYGDLGVYGALDFETPNIDKLATGGIRFTHYYSPQPVCSASRAGLLTGCYPNRVGISGALFPKSKNGLNPDETTLAEILKTKGYTNGIFGKWHLGHHKEFLPLQHGFDEYVGLPYSNDMWPNDFEGKPNPKRNMPPLPLIEGNEIIETIDNLEEQDPLTTLYTEKAVDFINRNTKDPFFVYIPHTMPHVPLGVSEKFKGKSKQGMYGDVIMEIDWSVQQVIKALEDKGIRENTLVIFTSDNGPWLNYGNHAGSSGGLREGKITTFEGGMRVPAIFNWPAKIKGGEISNSLASSIDILPTLASIVQADLPSKRIDGVDISEILLEDINAEPREELYYYFGKNNLEAVRYKNWKMVLPHNYHSYEGAIPGNDGRGGPRIPKRTEKELYNLRRDPSERTNMINERPDIVKIMDELVEKARKDLGDNLTNREGENRREPGWHGKPPLKRASKKHMGMSGEVVSVTPPSEKYAADGGKTLIDGIFGIVDDFQNRWLGYNGNDIELIVDLKAQKEIKNVNVSFLKDYGSWIFLPEKVLIYTSSNKNDFQLSKEFIIDNNKNEADINIENYVAQVDEKAKYIKIRALSMEAIPKWHVAEGEKPWVFIDEVVIE